MRFLAGLAGAIILPLAGFAMVGLAIEGAWMLVLVSAMTAWGSGYVIVNATR